jgi:hypothetical protein
MREILTNAELDAEVVALDARRNEPRIKLVPFNKIRLSTERRYLVKGIIPHPGLTVIWGPPKSGKSFWTSDVVLHAALGWEYRERRVKQGSVVYCCFEGQSGIQARVEAFRQRFLTEEVEDVPFFLQPVTMDLVKEHGELIAAIRNVNQVPVAVVLDTLNRSLVGSESSDEDMSAYVRATDAIRDAFNCSVLVVHHCGVSGDRPRGHTSLTGAAEAQLAVKKDLNENVIVTVEYMKDGKNGDTIVSRLELVEEVGLDEDGDRITSCVVVPSETQAATENATKLTQNQRTFFDVLARAGRPLSAEEWAELADEAGLTFKRRATYWDLRNALQKKGLIYEGVNGWQPK